MEFAYRGILLATAAMVIRNAVLLAILAPRALVASIGAHVSMLAATAAFLLPGGKPKATEVVGEAGRSGLELPFSFWLAVKYGALFLVLHVAGVAAQHFAGQWGFYATSLLGGLVSSASAVAAAASLAGSGAISPEAAGTGAVIASLTSVAVNLPFVAKARHASLTRRLALSMGLIAVAGAAGAWAWRPLASMLALAQ